MKRRSSFVLTLAASCCLLATSPLHAENRQTIRKTTPEYPVLALKMRVAGTVTVETVVDPDGSVVDAKAVNGHTMLKPAAMECVKKWRFEPSSTKTVEMVAVNFSLP